jgi:hypothetical protein
MGPRGGKKGRNKTGAAEGTLLRALRAYESLSFTSGKCRNPHLGKRLRRHLRKRGMNAYLGQ